MPGTHASVSVLKLRGDYTKHGGESTVSNAVKYIYTVDYPLGHKAQYLEWVKSVVDALQAPEEIKRIASYDNYFGASPHRIIEFEFDNMADATKYFEREEIRKIFEDVVNHGIPKSFYVLNLRGDYTKKYTTK